MGFGSALTVPYCGSAPPASEILLHWNKDPVLVACLLLAGLLWKSLGPSGKAENRAFWAGLAVLAVAFVSPLCALSSGLFAVRSVHHLLIVAAAAPLLGYALPGRAPASVGAAAGLHILIFWIWHVPSAYSAALSADALYWLMEVSLLGSGILFWTALFRTKSPAAELGGLFAMVGQMGLLGAIITFAPQPLYAPHLLTTQLYGLTALEDQQLAGLIMWVASLPFYIAAALPVIARRLSLARQVEV